MAGTRPHESAVDRIRERVDEKAARRAATARAAAEPTERDANRPPPGAPSERELPGLHAEKPTDIPWAGWKQILKRAWAEHKADNMPIIAGGVAFFGFLAIFPALIATISIYGLVASPEDVTRQIQDLSAQLPEDAQNLLKTQLESIVKNSGSALSIGLVVSILGALFSASGGVNNLITAINLAYDEVEARGAIKLRLLSLALTLGAI